MPRPRKIRNMRLGNTQMKGLYRAASLSLSLCGATAQVKPRPPHC